MVLTKTTAATTHREGEETYLPPIVRETRNIRSATELIICQGNITAA